MTSFFLLIFVKKKAMINAVRNTVLAILNKNNYGYISPSDFNLFAKQAQLDIFDEYFIGYNTQVNQENGRVSGTGYADIKKGYEEVIDTFSLTNSLGNFNNNLYYAPSVSTTGSDYYLINKVLIYKTVTSSGATTQVNGGNFLINASATFQSDGVSVGDTVSVSLTPGIVSNLTVVAIPAENQIQINSSVLITTGIDYAIYKSFNLVNEAEQVNHSKITMLNKSLLTAPNITFPSYTQEGDLLTLYPINIVSVGRVVSQYIRYPQDPKWTYVSLTGGQPIFDQSQSDYQDFELPPDDVNNLVSRILQYAGMSIREISAVQFGQSIEQQENQEK